MDMRRRPPMQRGFTILEALIALLVMSFGILALAGMQLMLSHNSDIAKQRSEATRLAQERMERMRAYDGIGSGTIDWNALPGAAETVTTNAAYTITPAMGGTSADAMRPVSVTVAWTDRTGTAQSVVLSSVISKIEPEDIGFVTNPLPLNQPLRRVKDRNINIPIPALDLGGGQSATQFSPTMAVVYSNTSGNVVQWCTLPNITNATAADVNAALSGGQCTSVTGYIVAGYVSRIDTTPATPAFTTDISDTQFNALGVNLSEVTRNTDGSQPITCQFADARDQNNISVTIPNYKYYLCVIPLSSPHMWDGTIRISGVDRTSDHLICRYQYTQSDLDSNERNMQPYSAVGKSIDEQNYVITRSSSGTCPSSMTVSGVSVPALHQDCRGTSASPASSTTCPTSPYP